MLKIVIIGAAMAGIGFLVGIVAVPALANARTQATTAQTQAITADDNEQAFEAMHEACQNGDTTEMQQAAQDALGDSAASIPCVNTDSDGAAGMMTGATDGSGSMMNMMQNRMMG